MDTTADRMAWPRLRRGGRPWACRRGFCWLALGCALACSTWGFAPRSAHAQVTGEPGFGRGVERLVERIAPSVVGVRVVETFTPAPEETDLATAQTAPARREVRLTSTGMVLTRGGELLTLFGGGVPVPAHGGQLTIEVTMASGELVQARWKASDPQSGLTLLELPPEVRAKPLRFAEQEARPGAMVVAFGSAHGSAQTYHMGLVSGPNTRLMHPAFPRLLRVSLNSTPEDVGSVLVNDHGDVVGLLAVVADTSQGSLSRPAPRIFGSRISVREAHGREAAADATGGSERVVFAVPGTLLQRVIQALRKQGVVTRGAVGASFLFLNHASPWSSSGEYRRGALVKQVDEAGTAGRAGLREGDLIARVDQRPMVGEADLYWFAERVQYGPVGSVLTIQVFRQTGVSQEVRTFEVPIGPAPIAHEAEPPASEPGES